MNKFWSFRDNGGKNFPGLAKRQKMSAGTVYEKKFLKNRKFHFFFQIWAIFSLLAKTFARFAKPAIWVCVEVIGEKHFFKYIWTFTLLWTLIQKTFSRKLFSRVVTTAIRASRGIFWLKVVFFKRSYICSSVLEFEQFFLFFDKKVRVAKKQPTNTEKKLEERVCRKIVFKSSSDFQQKSLNN